MQNAYFNLINTIYIFRLASFRSDPESEVIEDEAEKISDLEWEMSTESQHAEKQQKPLTCVSSVLRSLMDTYASESEGSNANIYYFSF